MQLCEQKNLAFYSTELFKEAINFYIQCKIIHIDTERIDSMGIALTKGSPYTSFINY